MKRLVVLLLVAGCSSTNIRNATYMVDEDAGAAGAAGASSEPDAADVDGSAPDAREDTADGGADVDAAPEACLPGDQCTGICEGKCEGSCVGSPTVRANCWGICNGTCEGELVDGTCKGTCDGTCDLLAPTHCGTGDIVCEGACSEF